MDRRIDTAHAPMTLAVSTPGGVARQYRVQYVDPADASWRMFAAFNRREPAERCLHSLQQRGQHARLISYAICPTAG